MACFERVWESAKPWFGEEVCVGRVGYWNDPAAPKPNSRAASPVVNESKRHRSHDRSAMQYALLIYSTEESTPEERQVVEAGVAPVLARPSVTSWARLHAPQTATTVRQQQGETLLTDGPFVDTKEFLGGLIVIEVDNLDVALTVAAELQALRPSSAIEVRPVRDEVPGGG